MNLSRPRPLLLASTASLLAVLAACGGSPTASPVPSSVAPTTTQPSPAGSATPGAGTPTAGNQAPVPVESNPPGDIPDNLAFVSYRNAAGGYTFTYPEGWSRTESGTQVSFTDKLNGLSASTSGVPSTLTVEAVRQSEIARLQQSVPAFEFRTIAPVSLPAGSGVRLVYRRNSAPDPVTGRQVRDEVESYLVGGAGKQVRLDLYGPVGADNVDAYRTISQSLKLS